MSVTKKTSPNLWRDYTRIRTNQADMIPYYKCCDRALWESTEVSSNLTGSQNGFLKGGTVFEI